MNRPKAAVLYSWPLITAILLSMTTTSSCRNARQRIPENQPQAPELCEDPSSCERPSPETTDVSETPESQRQVEQVPTPTPSRREPPPTREMFQPVNPSAQPILVPVEEPDAADVEDLPTPTEPQDSSTPTSPTDDTGDVSETIELPETCDRRLLSICLRSDGGNACFPTRDCGPAPSPIPIKLYCDYEQLDICLDHDGGDQCYVKWQCPRD